MTRCGEEGISESTQWALLIPAVLLTVLGMIQAAIWLHGRTTLATAAAAAAEVEALRGAIPGSAEPLASAIAARAGVLDVRVTTLRATDRVEVTVSGRVPIFWDLGQGGISASRSLPVERLRRP